MVMYFRPLTILVILCWTLTNFPPSLINLGSIPGCIINVAPTVLRRGLIITSVSVLVTVVCWITAQYMMCFDPTNSVLSTHVGHDAHRNNQVLFSRAAIQSFPSLRYYMGFLFHRYEVLPFSI